MGFLLYCLFNYKWYSFFININIYKVIHTRSLYGFNSYKSIQNIYTLQELCGVYSDGEDNKVDVFSTNPNLDVQKPFGPYYGDMKYIESREDYERWKDYTYLINNIKETEGKTDMSEEFKDELKYLMSRLEEYDTSFTEPMDYPIDPHLGIKQIER